MGPAKKRGAAVRREPASVAPEPAPAAAPPRLAAPPEQPAEPVDPLNRSKPPLASSDLDERAQHLFDAIAQNEPSLGDDFFFPRDPFLVLKDVADPGRYHAELLAAYHRDIRTLHASRSDWATATFASFELGTVPTWVAPGKEYNKIGYGKISDCPIFNNCISRRNCINSKISNRKIINAQIIYTT